jgi:hypothetical protein
MKAAFEKWAVEVERITAIPADQALADA